MRYKIVKEIELDEKADKFVSISAQCMLRLLMNRLYKDDYKDVDIDDDRDIDYNFSMYGDESVETKTDLGYTNESFKGSADSYVRGL